MLKLFPGHYVYVESKSEYFFGLWEEKKSCLQSWVTEDLISHSPWSLRIPTTLPLIIFVYKLI